MKIERKEKCGKDKGRRIIWTIKYRREKYRKKKCGTKNIEREK